MFETKRGQSAFICSLKPISAMLILGSCVSSYAVAATTDGTRTPTSPTDIKSGDTASLPVDAKIFKSTDDGGEEKCARANSEFDVDEVTPLTTVDQSTNPKDAKPEDVGTVRTEIKGSSAKTIQTSNVNGTPQATTTTTDTLVTLHFNRGLFNRWFNWKSDISCGGDKAYDAVIGQSYQTKLSALKAHGIIRQGFVWGPLIIPYKFEFKDHSFAANPSTVAYVGYEFNVPGEALSLVAVAGPGASTNSNSTGTTTTTSTTGGTMSTTTTNNPSSSGTKLLWTFGGGVVTTLGGTFKVGLLAGLDYSGSSASYKYEGKPWAALSIGVGL